MTTDPQEAGREEFLALVLKADQLARGGDPTGATEAVEQAELLIKTERVPEHRIRMSAMIASTRQVVDDAARRAAKSAAKKARKAAEQAGLRCSSCRQPGSLRPVRKYGERYLCGPCWNARRTATCTECLKTFSRPKDSPGARLCPNCRPGGGEESKSVRTVGGGLPTLGKRN